MLLTGLLTFNGNEYLFSRAETDNKIGWYIFNKSYENEAGQTFKISIESLMNFKHKDIKPFIVSAQETTIEETKYWGNPYIVESVLKAYNQAKNFKYDTEEVEKNVEQDGIFITNRYLSNSGQHLEFTEFVKGLYDTEYTKKDTLLDKLGREKKLPNSQLYSLSFNFKGTRIDTLYQTKIGKKSSTIKLDWQKYDIGEFTTREERERSLASKQKSLAQLRILHDFSWYFDKNGKTKKNYKIINTIDELEWFCKNVFPKVKFWAVDIESTGLKEFTGNDPNNFDHTVSIMMSWEKNQAIFIPIDMEYMQNIPRSWVAHLKYWLETIPAVGHNIGFDARALLVDFGIKLNAAHDTMQLNFNLNCHRAKFHNGLKYLEHYYLGVDTIELKDIFGSKKLAGLFKYIREPELALIYACPDVEYCLELFQILYDKLPVSSRRGYKLDMDVLKYIVQMDCIGNRINTDLALKLREADLADKDLIEEMIYRLVGQSLSFKEKHDELVRLMRDKKIDDKECEKLLVDFLESDDYKDAYYKFDINSNKKLATVMFDYLDYPVQGRSEKTQLPMVDAKSLGALMQFKTNKTVRLKKDIISHESAVLGEKIRLIEAEKYNELTYPLALLIVEYRLRNKRDTTFFKQLLDTAIEDRYYSSSKMASAETFRIINVIQTLQGFMKKMIIPYDDDHYLLVFDFSQIEYRFMSGLGHQDDLSIKLNGFRADFHKECCALLHKIEAYMVTSKMRKAGKSLNFAIPYGMGEYSIAEQLHKKVNTETLIDARRQLNQWKKIFSKIWDYLEDRRQDAVTQGYVANPLGRRRYFFNGEDIKNNLTEAQALEQWKDEMNKIRKKAVRRAAGNYPIQSGAADLFKMALRDFRKRLEEEGLDELVKTTAIVHDEIVSSVHKSVNPYFLYKIIWEECMKQVKGHPRYFAGISICDNWYEGKDDLYEAPIEFVKHVIDSGLADEKFVYQEDAKNTVLHDIKEYMDSVFMKEFADLGLDLKKHTVDLKSMMPKIKDYFLRDKIAVYHPLPKYKGKPDKNYEDDLFIRSFEEFILNYKQLDDYLIIYPDNYPQGNRAILGESSRVFIDEIGNTLKVESYIKPQEAVKSEEVKTTEEQPIDLNLNLDLNLGFDEDDDYVDAGLGLDLNDGIDELFEETGSDDRRINMLRMYEMSEDGEEGGIFAESIYYTSSNINTIRDEQEEIDANPEKFNQHYSELASNLTLTPNKLIVKVDNLSQKQKEDLVEYINNHVVSVNDLGGVEFVRRVGTQYDNTGIYVKNYNIDELKSIVDGVLV